MKKQMTSKQRVLATLAHKEPDRVPINYFANPGIDKRLKRHFGLAENDNAGLNKALGVDFSWAGRTPPYIGPQLHKDEGDVKVDIWGVRRRWVEHQSGGYWDYCDFPLKDATLEQMKKWPMPNPDHFDYNDVIKQCETFKDYCVVYGNPGLADIINSTGMIRTMENVLVDLMTDNPACLYHIDKRLNILYEITKRSLDAAKGKIDLLWTGEDLGTQIGPMISLDLFRKHIRPRHQKFIDLAKSFGIPVMIHSCGSSSWAFPDFIEMGIKVVDTLQPEAVNMQPDYLKRTFGDKLIFHGCISTAGPVASGTQKEAVEDARKILDIMKPGGGYMFSPTHALQDNSPTENVLAVYELAKEYGKY